MDIITNLRPVLLVVHDQFVLDFFCAIIKIYMKVEMILAVKKETEKNSSLTKNQTLYLQ